MTDGLFFICAKCGAHNARRATYAGILCEACEAALPKACDFCNRRPPAWLYPGRPFEALDGLSHVDGNWLACERCHALIAAGRCVALCDLAVKNFLRHQPAARRDKKWIRRMIAELHNNFRSHRAGDPYRIDH